MSEERFQRLPYTPPHLFRPNGTYFITAKTLGGIAYIAGARPQAVIDALQFACEARGWRPLAWVVLTNHYHCLLQAPDDASGLTTLLHSVHKFTVRNWNREDRAPGRQVWYRYWDTCITNESSFYARLNYIHYNPVKHGLVERPELYPYSSYPLWQAAADMDALEALYPWGLLDLEQ